jgi:hypothetical protein
MLTTCVELESGRAVFDLDTAAGDVQAAIMGHKIVGRGMAPATLFSEIALEVARFLAKHENPTGTSEVHHQVLDIAIDSSLLMDATSTRPTLRMIALGRISDAEGIRLEFGTYATGASDPPSLHHHATCRVTTFLPESLEAYWGRLGPLIDRRAERIIGGAEEGKSDVISRDMAYHLFKVLVDYSPAFMGMRTVWLSEDGHEAVAEVKLDETAPKSSFVVSPFLQDSLGQMCVLLFLSRSKISADMDAIARVSFQMSA